MSGPVTVSGDPQGLLRHAGPSCWCAWGTHKAPRGFSSGRDPLRLVGSDSAVPEPPPKGSARAPTRGGRGALPVTARPEAFPLAPSAVAWSARGVGPRGLRPRRASAARPGGRERRPGRGATPRLTVLGPPVSLRHPAPLRPATSGRGPRPAINAAPRPLWTRPRPPSTPPMGTHDTSGMREATLAGDRP